MRAAVPGRSGARSRPGDTPAATEGGADPVSAAREICLQLLERQPRTRAQLAAALRRRDVPDPVAEQVLVRLTEVGLVDDAAFATAWVSSRQAGRGLARRALAHELRARGIEEATVEQAVGSVDADTELATARSLVARRLPTTAGLPREARIRRLVGQLARRGYSPGLAVRVVKEALAVNDR